MSDSVNTTTSIMDLPTDPANGGSMNNNINLNASETLQQSNMKNNSSSINLVSFENPALTKQKKYR
jgi:hypothetical protein